MIRNKEFGGFISIYLSSVAVLIAFIGAFKPSGSLMEPFVWFFPLLILIPWALFLWNIATNIKLSSNGKVLWLMLVIMFYFVTAPLYCILVLWEKEKVAENE